MTLLTQEAVFSLCVSVMVPPGATKPPAPMPSLLPTKRQDAGTSGVPTTPQALAPSGPPDVSGGTAPATAGVAAAAASAAAAMKRFMCEISPCRIGVQG